MNNTNNINEIIQFISNNNNITINNINLYDNHFIKLILNIIKSIIIDNIHIPYYNIINIKKINKNYPLLYYFLKNIID
jgi:hypothetical protein